MSGQQNAGCPDAGNSSTQAASTDRPVRADRQVIQAMTVPHSRQHRIILLSIDFASAEATTGQLSTTTPLQTLNYASTHFLSALGKEVGRSFAGHHKFAAPCLTISRRQRRPKSSNSKRSGLIESRLTRTCLDRCRQTSERDEKRRNSIQPYILSQIQLTARLAAKQRSGHNPDTIWISFRSASVH